ncbi:MAG: hypothetical protein KJ944_19355 [Alphaproteobacteria bacterium]|nr:hypothetical protein [Alphaproteobacteria bacterium]MBU1560773.1 hypothetical protein [Alphaproteobacteria bacterium]MBU2304747.1 hypothetical protein [Alphaproteobacteria bacterium]MBU2370043.1 hypothetical protein [Alphaproteobacteria bacterium]
MADPVNALKLRVKAAKADHDLHVALLVKREKLTKAEAVVMAYLDGLGGLNDRLNPPKPSAN